MNSGLEVSEGGTRMLMQGMQATLPRGLLLNFSLLQVKAPKTTMEDDRGHHFAKAIRQLRYNFLVNLT
jgi:hypothetical protein